MSEVGVIVKDLPYRFGTPHMSCSARIWLAELCIVVIRGDRYAVLIKLVSNVMRRYSACSHFKDVADDRCGFWIDHRQMIRIIAFRVTERGAGRAILASLCIGFDNRLDFLGSRSGVPLVEQVQCKLWTNTLYPMPLIRFQGHFSCFSAACRSAYSRYECHARLFCPDKHRL